MDNLQDVAAVVAKSTPPLAMTAWSMWGHSLQEWAAIVAICYTILMTFFLLVDRYKKWKRDKEI